MKVGTTASATIILETRKTNKEKLHPICLRVTHLGKSKYFCMVYPKGDDFKNLSGTIYMSGEQFNEIVTTANPRGVKKAFKALFIKLEEEAGKVIKKIDPFTFDDFYKKYFKIADEAELFNQMNLTAKKMRQDGRISTAVSYEYAIKSLQGFTGKSSLNFQDVTVKFLRDYEKWMIENNKSKTTVGIYLRNVRTMFNASSIQNLVYPFGKKKGKYAIPTGHNIKKALTFEQVNEIAAYRPIPDTWEERARDYWLFSYLANGANIKDIALLKYKNIDGEVIRFVRSKTKSTTEKEQVIEVIITQRIGRIIDKWGQKPSESDQYIFPILNKEMTPQQQYVAIRQTVQNINKNMNRIAKAIGISTNLTTYVARHSFATVLKRSGASVDFIQESLGHQSAATTQSYLANFEIEKKREYSKSLLSEDQQK